jgi:hypothetical protein
MNSSMLSANTIVPPLLEQQISPPHRIIAEHLRYLQKWREYLFWLWNDDNHKSTDIQRSVDELIKSILLIEFIKQFDDLAIPTLEEILKCTGNLTPYNICKEIHEQVSCRFLKVIFDPDKLDGPNIKLPAVPELSRLSDISNSINVLYKARMPVTLLGDFHQLCMDIPIADITSYSKSEYRRSKGIYYTPAPLVDYLVCNVLEKAFHQKTPEQIKNMRMLDPSCGCGAFLIASLRYTLEWLKNKYYGGDGSPNLQESLDLLGSMIHGIDLDCRAVKWTRRLLLLTVRQSFINSRVTRSDVKRLDIPNLEKNIICGDFLETTQNTFTQQAKPFHIIIGGPPFVRVQEIYKSNPKRIGNYKKNFRTAVGQFDLYMLFIENCIRFLADNGHIGMSVSNTFLRSENGRNLRKLISETCAVTEVTEFEDSKIYPGALVQIALLILQKAVAKSPVKYGFIKGKGGLRRKLNLIGKKNNLVQLRELPVIACTSDSWVLRSENESKILVGIEKTGIPIRQLPIKVSFGASTGADSVFFLRKAGYLNSETVFAKSRFLDDVFTFESSILRPVLRGRCIKAYSRPITETLCIFPYDSEDRIIPEDVLQVEFPCTYKYLKLCQSKLYLRKMRHKQFWYAFRNEDISCATQTPKIISSVVNSGGTFTLDEDQHFFCNNSVLIIQPDTTLINPYFLLGVLNSCVLQKWAQHRMPTLGSGWQSYRVSIIRKFPIPMDIVNNNPEVASQISDYVYALLHTRFGTKDCQEILSLIDEEVCKLYGLHARSIFQ